MAILTWGGLGYSHVVHAGKTRTVRAPKAPHPARRAQDCSVVVARHVTAFDGKKEVTLEVCRLSFGLQWLRLHSVLWQQQQVCCPFPF